MTSLIDPQQVFIDIDIPNRVEALDFLATKAVELNFSTDKDAVLDAYIAREKQGPTGLTDGFALPHAKTPAVNKLGIFVVKLSHPIEWPDFDNKLCDILISLLIPASDEGATTIKLIGQIADVLIHEDFRVALRQSSDPEKISNMLSTSIAAQS